MGFAERLKTLRQDADVTQEELANYLQVSRSTIAGYESKGRQPDYDKLYMIACFFHVSTDYLISGKDFQPQIVSSHSGETSFNERMAKHQFINTYSRLSSDSKQDLLEYAELLSLRDRMK